VFTIKISFDIDSYKTKFTGGIKQYLFFAVFNFPNITVNKDVKFAGSNSLNKLISSQDLMSSMLAPLGYGSNSNVFPYLVRSTALPESSFEEVVIPYPGLPLKMAGSRSFGDWSVSFNVDAECTLINAFQSWHTLIYDPSSHIPTSRSTYAIDQDLFILDNDGIATQHFKLRNAWPKVVHQIAFDYSSSDLATMDVTFSYDFYDILKDAENKGVIQSVINKFTGSANFGGLF
jgi:hypothetical protein